MGDRVKDDFIAGVRSVARQIDEQEPLVMAKVKPKDRVIVMKVFEAIRQGIDKRLHKLNKDVG